MGDQAWVQGADGRQWVEPKGIGHVDGHGGRWILERPVHAVDPATGIAACGHKPKILSETGRWPISMGVCDACFDLTKKPKG